MIKLTCWSIDDPSLYKATQNLKGNSYMFLLEYVDAMGQDQALAQYIEENLLHKWGSTCFDLVARTIEERTGLSMFNSEDVRTAFADCLPVTEYLK
jgi:hypothetical protein